ncbi:M48 family metallopeptidase [Acinetobacter brisouii]
MSQVALPEIKIVRHARATQLRLRVYTHEIRLTVPLRCKQKQVQQFLEDSQLWLQDTWQKIQQQTISDFPEYLYLFNFPQLAIVPRLQPQNFVFEPENNCVYVHQKQAAKALKSFVIAHAKNTLPEFLEDVSQQIGLPYQSYQIRFAKSRWGSCSTQHKIMLNAALILLPKEIIRYVCVHELVHTRHFNHSAEFWQEVARHDANFQQHRQILKKFQWSNWWLG